LRKAEYIFLFSLEGLNFPTNTNKNKNFPYIDYVKIYLFLKREKIFI